MILNLLLAVLMISPVVNGILVFELPGISDYELEYDYSDDVYAAVLVQQTAENVESVLIE